VDTLRVVRNGGHRDRCRRFPGRLQPQCRAGVLRHRRRCCMAVSRCLASAAPSTCITPPLWPRELTRGTLRVVTPSLTPPRATGGGPRRGDPGAGRNLARPSPADGGRRPPQLENRSGRQATGGSNPSPSANCSFIYRDLVIRWTPANGCASPRTPLGSTDGCRASPRCQQPVAALGANALPEALAERSASRREYVRLEGDLRFLAEVPDIRACAEVRV